MEAVLVADDAGTPVGFVACKTIDEEAYLAELDVIPAYARRGIGSLLALAVADWAKSQGFSYLTLTTYADLPFNAPFYARLGFEIFAPVTGSTLAAILEKQATRLGDGRVAMRLRLA